MSGTRKMRADLSGDVCAYGLSSCVWVGSRAGCEPSRPDRGAAWNLSRTWVEMPTMVEREDGSVYRVTAVTFAHDWIASVPASLGHDTFARLI